MKNKIISIMFCILISGVMITNILTPDRVLSYSERRPLAQMPEFTKEVIFGDSFDTLMESYALDQFAGRDNFRSIKAICDLKLLGKLDNNNLYVINDVIFKQEYPMNDQSIAYMAHKLDQLYQLYFKDCKVMFGIIPDKSEYVASESNHLSLDYYKMTEALLTKMSSPVWITSPQGESRENHMNYIDLKEILGLEDYYKTDLHWRQENLSKLVSSIGNLFDFSTDYDRSIDPSRLKSYAPFYGAYYGQAALKLPADTLRYVEDEYTKNAVVTDYDEGKKEPAVSIYNTNKLGSIDTYDLFFSGNSPLITVENPLVKTQKELVIFRDSFGSSLAPLLLEGYSKITLVDLRFISAENIGSFVEFSNQDVLILYGQSILNNSQMLK